MDGQVVFLYGVEDFYLFAFCRLYVSRVADLSSHFGIERCLVEHELVHRLVFRLDGAVSCEYCIVYAGHVVAEESNVFAVMELHPVS